MREAKDLAAPTELYYAQPLEDNLFEWHFTIRGPGGVYHGRVLIPGDYPMKPPNIILLTPNGRFEINKKICLSISGYHPETWRPAWSIRTALLALVGFMPTHGLGAIARPGISAGRAAPFGASIARLALPDLLPDAGLAQPRVAAQP
uniref:UBIQUITIN_CONJUGAT_2 domain-containing protein n=1 Tax=Macrostomum lignano TaxID=282301 RepID=A0A1I8FGD5_9PLAT